MSNSNLDIFYSIDYISYNDYKINISIDSETREAPSLYLIVTVYNRTLLKYKWGDTRYVDLGDMTSAEYLNVTKIISECVERDVEFIRTKIIYEY